MIIRSLTQCSIRPLRFRTPFFRTNLSSHRATPQCRTFSSNAPPSFSGASSSSSSSSAGMLVPFMSELDKIAPSFQVNGSQIKILRSPSEFYETLKLKIKNAKKRIFLSTLYIGKSEKELITVLRDALHNNPSLKLSILTDCLRGTREAPDPSCASLLAPLIQEFGLNRIDIRMYHTPNLTGLRKRHVPKRINEGWGLQHMKLYGIDDDIILSGANLSEDYFTNRQDRYHVIESDQVTDYYARIHDAVCSLSFRVLPSTKEAAGFELEWPVDNKAPSPLVRPSHFVKDATPLLRGLISLPKAAKPLDGSTSNETTSGGKKTEKDTTVYMVSQMTQLMSPDYSTEVPAITHILKTLAREEYGRNSSWTFTAGYFNPAPSLTELLLETKSTKNTVITASPYANGFYGSKGVSGLLPDAYTYLARKFLQKVHARGRQDDITLKEWRQGTVGEPGAWTYHAKGLWVKLPGETWPSITSIGSSNYTKRSYSLDLETGALIVTGNRELKKRLGEEEAWLQEYACEATREDLAREERRVGVKVRVAMWIVQLVGGAL